MRATTWGYGLSVALAWAVAGCGAKSAGSQVSLSARATSAAVSEGAPAGLKVDDHVTLARVRIVIRDVKLESHAVGTIPSPTPTPTPTATSHADDSAPGGVGTEAEAEDEREHGDEVEVHAGPVLLDLGADALTTSKLQEALAVTVPAGTYDELRLRIHPLEDGEQTGDADVDGARASVILDGTYDGAPFRFVSRLSARQKLEGSFTVGGSGGSNITLDIDVSGWFSAGGISLDPSSVANQAAIEQNIRRSLRAFDDHDHDGRDDHGEHGTEAGDDHGGQGSGQSGSGGSGGSDDGANHT